MTDNEHETHLPRFYLQSRLSQLPKKDDRQTETLRSRNVNTVKHGLCEGIKQSRTIWMRDFKTFAVENGRNLLAFRNQNSTLPANVASSENTLPCQE